jgi:predicted RNA-binding protein associated with RNAse of E/G family
MNQEIRVHKLDHQGKEILVYTGTLLERFDSGITLEARFAHPDEWVNDVLIRRGDRFVESFYTDRWYNIFAIYDVDDAHLKGWYCNITRPAKIQAGEVYAEDLGLDLFVYPDGSWQVLDEEEFAEMELSAQDQQSAAAALKELKRLAKLRRKPFSIAGEG